MRTRLLLLIVLSYSVAFGQIKTNGPKPDISTVYLGYENPVLFSKGSSKVSFTVNCVNGALSLLDSVWFIRPYTMTKACTLIVIEKTTKKRIGWYELTVRQLEDPVIYFDSIPSGDTLTGNEQWLRCGYDLDMKIRFVKYEVLSHQLFIENRASYWVSPGGGVTPEEAEELKKLSMDLQKTKIRFILQVMDQNGEITNKRAEFFI